MPPFTVEVLRGGIRNRGSIRNSPWCHPPQFARARFQKDAHWSTKQVKRKNKASRLRQSSTPTKLNLSPAQNSNALLAVISCTVSKQHGVPLHASSPSHSSKLHYPAPLHQPYDQRPHHGSLTSNRRPTLLPWSANPVSLGARQTKSGMYTACPLNFPYCAWSTSSPPRACSVCTPSCTCTALTPSPCPLPDPICCF